MRTGGFAVLVALTMAGWASAAAAPGLVDASMDAQPPTGCVASPEAPSCTFLCTAGVPFLLIAKSTASGAGSLTFWCGGHGGSCGWGASATSAVEFCATFSINEDDAVGLCEVTGTAMAFCGA